MASLRNRNGTYYASFYDSNRSPREKRISLKTKDKSTARQLLAKMERMWQLGEADPWQDDMHAAVRPSGSGENVALSEALNRFLDSRREMNVTGNTIRSYEEIVDGLLRHANGSASVRRLSARELRPYVLSSDVKATARRKRIHQLRCLCGIAERPEPLYHVRPNSPRVYPLGEHLPLLGGRVRRALLRELVEVDLRSAHLACACRVMELPRVEQFLATGKSIWKELFAALGFGRGDRPLFKTVKNVLKHEGLYPALYGRKRGYLIRRIDDCMGEVLKGTAHADRAKTLGKKFAEHPLIDEVLTERDEMLEKIEREEGARDIYGRWIALPGGSGDHVLTGDAGPETLLSYLATTIEVDLMSSIFELQEQQRAELQRPKFEVLLMQHDGCSVRIVDKSRTTQVLAEIKAAVRERAQRLGVLTELEVVPSTLPEGMG